MQTNITGISSYTKTFAKSGTVSKTTKKDYTKIKMLIASLSSAKTSLEASIYVSKLRGELASLQASDDSAMIKKVKKIIQNGDKKIINLQKEEKLEQEKREAEIKGDETSAKEISAELKKKRKEHRLKENIKLPNDNNNITSSEPMTIENLNVTI